MELQDLEDDLNREIEGEDDENLIFKVIKAVLALLLVFLMVYFSGLHEYFFFRETPTHVTVSEMEKIVNVERVEVPVYVSVVKDEVFGSERSSENIISMIENSSMILSQGGIDLEIKKIRKKNLTRDDASQLLRGNFELIDTTQDGVNIILVKTLGGLNGIAYPGKNIVIIPDYIAGRDYRTLSHELGHVFGLGHQEEGKYVMSQGATGLLFSKEEVIKMREKIDEKF